MYPNRRVWVREGMARNLCVLYVRGSGHVCDCMCGDETVSMSVRACASVCVCHHREEGGQAAAVDKHRPPELCLAPSKNPVAPAIGPDIHLPGPWGAACALLGHLARVLCTPGVKMDEHLFACHRGGCACWRPRSHTWSTLAVRPPA